MPRISSVFYLLSHSKKPVRLVSCRCEFVATTMANLRRGFLFSIQTHHWRKDKIVPRAGKMSLPLWRQELAWRQRKAPVCLDVQSVLFLHWTWLNPKVLGDKSEKRNDKIYFSWCKEMYWDRLRTHGCAAKSHFQFMSLVWLFVPSS